MEKEVGVVTHYFGKVSVAAVELTDTLKIGDKIHIVGAHDNLYQEVTSMQIEHNSVEEAGKGGAVGIKVEGKVHPGSKVYKVIEE